MLVLLVVAIGAGYELHGLSDSRPADAGTRAASVETPPANDPAPPPAEAAFEEFVPPVTGSLLTAQPDQPPPAPEVEPPARAVEDVVAAALPAVASIDAGGSRGTGFFVHYDLVVTNAHVVGTQTQVRLQADGAAYTARVILVEPGVDLALLHVAATRSNQPTLLLGAGLQARPGEEVVAIGYALGSLSNTVTRGIVSAIRQNGGVSLLQTDAAINPGNSGGPLLDLRGRVVGINSMSVAKQVGEGLGFAIAAEHASRLLEGQHPSVSGTPLTRLTESMNGTIQKRPGPRRPTNRPSRSTTARSHCCAT